jgi:hypothetical protein
MGWLLVNQESLSLSLWPGNDVAYPPRVTSKEHPHACLPSHLLSFLP